MIAVPDIIDALLDVLGRSTDLSGVQILDGADVQSQALEGIAVGASREDDAIQFELPASDVAGGQGERDVVLCLAWSGSGETNFRPHRSRVVELVAAVEAALALDRTLGGVVATAWLTGGALTQEQVGGSLVTAEFRIETARF